MKVFARNLSEKSLIKIRASEAYAVHTLHGTDEKHFGCKKEGPHTYIYDGTGKIKNISGGGMSKPFYDVLEHTAQFTHTLHQYAKSIKKNKARYEVSTYEEAKALNTAEQQLREEIRNIATKYVENLERVFPNIPSRFAQKEEGRFLSTYFTIKDCIANQKDLLFFRCLQKKTLQVLIPHIVKHNTETFLQVHQNMEKETHAAFQRYEKKIAQLETLQIEASHTKSYAQSVRKKHHISQANKARFTW